MKSLSEALQKQTERAGAASSELTTYKANFHASQRRVAELEQNEAALQEQVRRAAEEAQARSAATVQLEQRIP